MLKKNDFLLYLIASIVAHAVVPFLVFNSKPKPFFVSAPIDVAFYTPAQKYSDPLPVEKTEQKIPEQVKEEVKEEPKIIKEDIVVKKKEKPREKPKPKAPPLKKEESKKVETPPQIQNVNTVQATEDARYEAIGSQFDGVSFDTANFKYAYYTNTIVRKINRFWQWSESYGRRRAVIYFKILKDGSITSISVKESSGDTSFDQNAHRAVQLASPFAPLPDGYTGNSLGVYLEFKYRN
ncbi:MAG: TonB family protein [Endomicrobium sp.]|jgi:protein TonB|nr:TonB family protein [Endomicrobium sp.]